MRSEEWYGCREPRHLYNAIVAAQRPSSRKLRLFTVAACLPHWNELKPVHRNALCVSEELADGIGTYGSLRDRFTAAQNEFDASIGVTSYLQPVVAPTPILRAVRCTLMGMPAGAIAMWDSGLPGDFLCDTMREIWSYPKRTPSLCGGEPYACTFCHGAGTCLSVDAISFDEYGKRHVTNPRSSTCMVCEGRKLIAHGEEEPCSACDVFRTQRVLTVAGAIYQDRSFESMPILADALEEAGCRDAQILRHLRAPADSTGTDYIKGTVHCRGCWALDLVLKKE